MQKTSSISRDDQIHLSDNSNKKISFYTHNPEIGKIRKLTNDKYWREYGYINTHNAGGSMDW